MSASATFERTQSRKCFGGEQLMFAHQASTTACRMEFALYLPPQAEASTVPMVVYLSGLTCTWENATTKAGFQRAAADLGLAVLCPDTSPRGPGVADDPAADLGQGAGFYVNATEAPWAAHYRMYDYVVRELVPAVVDAHPIDGGRLGITGHSMGGHGALTLGLRHPDVFRSVSAFSPIVAPTRVPWGQKALTAYLGEDRSAWAEHDACELVRRSPHPGTILVDQGADDPFLASQLQPERFERAAREGGQSVNIRIRPGYDHSYYFVASFIDDHLRHHAVASK